MPVQRFQIGGRRRLVARQRAQHAIQGLSEIERPTERGASRLRIRGQLDAQAVRRPPVHEIRRLGPDLSYRFLGGDSAAAPNSATHITPSRISIRAAR
jgi:hypothetical protein